MAKRRQTRKRATYWRVNQNIYAPKLRVIDSEGKQLGILSQNEALSKAKEQDLDLVEIAPKANPPVAKIIDFAKFKYQEEKREREARKKERRGADQKEIWLTPFMGDGDYQVRIDHIREFLGDGYKVRATVRFKGRQMGHKEFGYRMTRRVTEDVANIAKVDHEPKFLGRQLMMTLSPVHQAKTEPKKKKEEEEKNESKEQKS